MNKALKLLLCLLLIESTNAEITPDQLAIIVNKNSKESIEIGELYSKLRQVPESRIIKLDLENIFEVDRSYFDKKLAVPLKHELSTNPNLQKTKAIVLTYGIPLKIKELDIPKDNLILKDAAIKSIISFSNDVKTKLSDIDDLNLKLNQKNITENGQNTLDLAKLNQEIYEIYLKSKVLGDKVSHNKIREISKELFGFNSLIEENNSTDEDKNRIIKLRSDNIIRSEELYAFTENRFDQYIKNQKKLTGELGTIQSLQQIIDKVFGENTSASVDSELSLIKLYPFGYPISNRIYNPYFLENTNKQINKELVTFISRIDGPNFDIVKQNIVHAIRVEKKGILNGNFLIDARGFGFEDRSELAVWDRKLTSLARSKLRDDINIEYDDSTELADFKDEISFYIGWYQLRNFKPGYKFKPGAIGFHIASEEAINLHNQEEKGWCKNLIENGVVTTVGAVEEPYLDSFPLPDKFFELLIEEKKTVIEAYYLSTKYLSWRQILFSDPLYKVGKHNSDN